MQWNPEAEEKYKKMLGKIPLFHRQITQEVVDKMAPQNAQERGVQFVEEEDIIKAFFSEVPQTFYSIMIRLMEDVDFDYKKYEKQ